jgi:hypothetical protein
MSPADYRVFFQQERESMLEPRQLQQFMVTRLWLRRFPKSQRFYPGSSYYLKHICEQEAEVYITNGAFIAAGVVEGFQIKRVRSSPNCLINISLIDKLRGLELRLQALEVGRMLGMVIVDGCS